MKHNNPATMQNSQRLISENVLICIRFKSYHIHIKVYAVRTCSAYPIEKAEK